MRNKEGVWCTQKDAPVLEVVSAKSAVKESVLSSTKQTDIQSDQSITLKRASSIRPRGSDWMSLWTYDGCHSLVHRDTHHRTPRWCTFYQWECLACWHGQVQMIQKDSNRKKDILTWWPPWWRTKKTTKGKQAAQFRIVSCLKVHQTSDESVEFSERIAVETLTKWQSQLNLYCLNGRTLIHNRSD